MPDRYLANADPIVARLGPIETEHRAVREDLAAIVTRSVTPEMRAIWRRHAAGLVLLPSFDEDGSTKYRYVVLEYFLLPPTAPLAYLQLLLLGQPTHGTLKRRIPKRSAVERGDLCQCKHCGKFFLATPPPAPDRKGGHKGRMIREYCPGTDHRELAHAASAGERARVSRERRNARLASKQRRRK